jgi:flagellar capping protein FliD
MASGLPPNIVDQLIEAERIPLKQIESKKTKQEDVLKVVTDLESKVGEINKNLGELTNTKGFVDTKLISGDPNVIDGSVDPGTVVNGEYSIEVVQLAQKPGAISNGFPDKDKTQMGVGVPEITCEVLQRAMTETGFHNRVKLIDVRRPDEYIGEYGHIKGAKLLTQGIELENYLKQEDKDTEIVFICRSGGRSGNATRAAICS